MSKDFSSRLQPPGATEILEACLPWEDDYYDEMILERFPDVQRLPASEKLLFVSELWNELEEHPESVPVSPEIVAELERRMEHFRNHPGEFTTWEAVKQRILGSPA